MGSATFVPALTDARRWPFVVVGSGFALLGIGLIVVGHHRYGTRGDRTLTAFAAFAAVLGIALLAILVIEG